MKMIREANENDLMGLLELYLYLHETSVPEKSDKLFDVWRDILSDRKHHVIIAEEDGIIISSCTCTIVPNLTRGCSPYSLIENVVTHGDYRGRGFARACIDYAVRLSENAGCYKVMLLTGSKDESVHRFYANSGFSSDIKTAYVRLINSELSKKE